jgi:hypothetical protein
VVSNIPVNNTVLMVTLEISRSVDTSREKTSLNFRVGTKGFAST